MPTRYRCVLRHGAVVGVDGFARWAVDGTNHVDGDGVVDVGGDGAVLHVWQQGSEALRLIGEFEKNHGVLRSWSSVLERRLG